MNLTEFLKEISYNKSVNDLDELYLKKSLELDLKSEIEYEREKEIYKTSKGIIDPGDGDYEGFFYFSLSVKVFTDSNFIPFKFITYNKDSNKESNNNILNNIEKAFDERRKRINYNYVDFFRAVKEKFDQVSSIDFVVEKKNNKIIIKDYDITEIEKVFGDKDLSKADKEKEEEEQKESNSKYKFILHGEDQAILLKKNDLDIGVGQTGSEYDTIITELSNKLEKNDSFMSIISDIYYKEIKNDEALYFSILGFDSDSKNPNDKLTHFLIISNAYQENQAFFYNRVRRIRDIASRIRVKHMQNLIDKANHEATKSAVAAIMSRNMSHNLGSHVMSYLKQHLSSVETIVSDNVLAEMIPAVSDSAEIQRNASLPFLVGMGHFLSYIQERQDFIATIATDYIPNFSSINFKDFVYDNINPDKRFERHKDANRQPDNILLGNIARSEGLGRIIRTTTKRSGQLSDIVLNFRDSNGQIFDGEPVVNNSNVIIDGRKDAFEALEAMRKLEVSLPGGVIGRQAIFSIVENIIRNTAKHGTRRNQGRLELTFDFYDKDLFEKHSEFVKLKKEEAPILKELIDFLKKEKDGIALNNDKQTKYKKIKEEYNRIREKLEPWNGNAAAIETSHHWAGKDKHNSLLEVLYLFYSKSIDADDLYFVTITDNVNISESAVNKLREALTDRYIDDNSRMKEGNKGIKEIRISAAWLRGARNEEEYYNSGDQIVEPQTGLKAPLVYVRQHNGCLQYIICLQKPRKVAVITHEPLSEKAINLLKRRKWRYYSPEDYKKERNKSYRFTLCEDGDLYNMIRPFSSSRVYVLDSNEHWQKIKAGITEEDSKNLERYLYESLVPEKSTIWIDDEKAKSAILSKTSEDKEYAEEKEGDYYQVKDVDVRVIDGCHFHVDYTFRKHHDTLEQFRSFMEKNPNGCQFVESITGATSTDRLIRNEKYDFRWYYSQLNAMNKKVAIFDERIFSRIYGLEEADFTKGNEADLDDLKRRYCEQNKIISRSINRCKTFDELNKLIEEKKIPPIISENRKDVYTKDYIALTYYQKGICFFTLIKDFSEECTTNSFGIYGLIFNGDNSTMPQCNVDYACRCERVGTITWTGQTIEIKIDASSKKHLENQFDYISIHQGLLDKMYEAFDIKYCKEKKIQLTTTLLKTFGNKSYVNHQWEAGFVPGLIVHSGRSKPSENDMPQMLPFIQYASIEHAVLDCKYSLIELLENARHEQ